jgi:DNA polymerase-1
MKSISSIWKLHVKRWLVPEYAVIDIESYDPRLHKMGDGSIRGDGAIIICGIYDGQTYHWFRPGEELAAILATPNMHWIMHNSMYDLSWLQCGYHYKFAPNAVYHDTMTRTALIDEYADLDLDTCCKKFKVVGKNAEDTIEQWFQVTMKPLGYKGTFWDNIEDAVATIEGFNALVRYNEQDCRATYNLFMVQEPFMRDLEEPYQLECDLIPVMMEMKKNGIRVDTVARDNLAATIHKELAEVEVQLKHKYNLTREIIASPKKMSTAMAMLGVKSPVLTPTGGQSWGADALDLIDHPAIPLIQATKNYAALLSKGLEGAFVEYLIGDRIHPTFSPNKRDDGGTITGRMACRHPNVQQISAREFKHGQKAYGQEVRSIFIPDDGCMMFAMDYSSIEARLLGHYATGPTAQQLRDFMIGGGDYHTYVMQMTGIEDRDVVKRMNFGFIYGMGLNKLITTNRLLFNKLAAEAGLDVNMYAKRVYDTYQARFPVIKDTMRSIENECQVVGYVISIGGRLHHKPKPYLMNGKWNSGIYKVTNYKIQGSAAEILKRGLVDNWKAGIFDELTLHITVHDENVVSVPYNKVGCEAAIEMQNIMTNAFHERLSVPMKVGVDAGENWGTWSGDVFDEMKAGNFTRRIR